MMGERLYTPAEIFEAAALGCQPEQLLPQGKTCQECFQKSTCAALFPEDFAPDGRYCFHPQNMFYDVWRPRWGGLLEEKQ